MNQYLDLLKDILEKRVLKEAAQGCNVDEHRELAQVQDLILNPQARYASEQ